MLHPEAYKRQDDASTIKRQDDVSTLAFLLLELLRFATKSKGGRHARCSKSKAPDIISSDVDWEISVIGLASRNWDSAFNSEGVSFGVNAA